MPGFIPWADECRHALWAGNHRLPLVVIQHMMSGGQVPHQRWVDNCPALRWSVSLWHMLQTRRVEHLRQWSSHNVIGSVTHKYKPISQCDRLRVTQIHTCYIHVDVPSMLWCCWLGCRKGIRPVKTEWWGTGVVICLEWGANDLHMAQLMPLPPRHLLLH